jgi:hypothetical protein
MSKLSTLKEWLTLESTAKLLTDTFSEQVSVSDVYQLALEGRLPLSVRLLMPTNARHLVRAPISEARRAPALNGGGDVLLDFRLDDETILRQEGDRVQVVGIYDLAMLGAERVILEGLYARSIGSAEPDMVSLEMVFLCDEADGFYELVNLFEIEMGEGEEPVYGYGSTSFLPADSQLVVRPKHVARLIEEASAPNDRPSGAQAFHSKRLTWLLHASSRFWKSFDRTDKTTIVSNEVVANWLVKQNSGFTPSLAKHAATIIRPEWAERGRPPEK